MERSGAFGGRHDEMDVAAGQHENGRLPVAAGAVERGHVRVLNGEELVVAAVDVVREPAAVALARQGEHALHAVAVGLDHHPLAPDIHARDAICGPGCGSPLRPCGGTVERWSGVLWPVPEKNEGPPWRRSSSRSTRPPPSRRQSSASARRSGSASSRPVGAFRPSATWPGSSGSRAPPCARPSPPWWRVATWSLSGVAPGARSWWTLRP